MYSWMEPNRNREIAPGHMIGAEMTKQVAILKAIAYTMFVLGLGLSAYHTVTFFHGVLHASLLSAVAAPVFIDGIQIFGKLMRGDAFARSTRTIGFRVQMFGAVLALIAQVAGGHAVGDKVLGALFVGGYIGMETLAAGYLKPASVDAAAAARAQAAAEVAKRAEAGRKAAATKAARRLEQEQAARLKAKADQDRRERAAQRRAEAKAVHELAATLPDDTRAYL